MLVGTTWNCMVSAEGEWSKMRKAYFSLLCSPGSLVVSSSIRPRLVLKATPSGVILVRAPLGRDCIVRWAPDFKASVHMVSVEKPAEWRVLETQLVPAFAVDRDQCMGSHGP